VCPEHIKITDNAIIPLKERIVTEYHDPVVWAWRKLTGQNKKAAPGGMDAAPHSQL
jgi:succinate dehydrogenase / fumarate reductase iron-sulfur subunit